MRKFEQPRIPGYGRADVAKMRRFQSLVARAERHGLKATLHSLSLRPRNLHRALLPRKADAAAAQRLTGKTYLRQGLEQLVLLILHRMEPGTYYRYALFEPERYARAAEFVTIRQTDNLLASINAHAPRDLTVDKSAFTEHCKRHRIPTVRQLCAIAPDAPLPAPSDELSRLASHGGVFVKPQSGEGSHGAGLLKRTVDDLWHLHTTDMQATGIAWEALWARLGNAGRGGHVVQERLRNHPDLSPFSDGALHTIRILTVRHNGTVLPLTAALRLGAAGAVTDDFFRGAIAAPMDLATGTLGAGVALEAGSLPGSISRLGPAQIPLTGFVVPFHRDAVALAVALHESLPDFVALGHDLAVTPTGAVVLESNDNWAPEVKQKPADRGLGSYPDFLDAMLAAGERQSSR